MRHKIITADGFEKYSRLVNDLFAHACELAVFDTQGALILAGPAVDKDELTGVLELPVKKLLSAAVVPEKVSISELSSNKTLYSLCLETDLDGRLGVLVLLADLNIMPDGGHRQVEFSNLLENVSTCIKQEYSMTQELNTMAIELGDRYEELNMVYDTVHHANKIDDVHDSLNKIAKNCVTYLDVGMAFISLPGKNISISYSGSSSPVIKTQHVVEKGVNYLYELVAESKSSIIINNPDNVQEVCPDARCKILSSPVFDGDKKVSGVIVIAKNEQAEDCSNSDRNLLEVMSKKVTQVVQENYDTVTGLMNRSAYKFHVENCLLATHNSGASNIVLDIDLDNMQVINESISFQAGDQLLKSVAEVLKDLLRDTDVVSRIGGDEFGVVLVNCPSQYAVQIADKIRQAIIGLGFVYEGKTQDVSATIGISIIDEDSENAASVISEAEVARDAAKEMGKNRVHIFQKDNSEFVRRKDEMRWVGRIKTALRENRFVIYGQMILSLHESDKPHHFEILLRLRDEDDNILTPWKFMPAAERYHLMPEIDRWVVDKTFSVISDYKARHEIIPSVAINLSGQSLSNEKFLEFIVERLDKLDYPCEKICFEITESAAIYNIDEALNFMSALKEKGCRFSLDDFGTGLSSFSYLKELPVDYLKIDGSFVKEIIDDPISEAMVTAINQVGHVMGLETIAEFVENDAICKRLKELGIDYAQGYGIGMPAPFLEQLEQLEQPAQLEEMVQ